jgi:hypothetical protein
MRQRTLSANPIQEPATPNMAVKGSSSVLRPASFHARRKQMCERQMEPQVKKEERPERASSQLKASLPFGAREM